jgi:hypothetical protein
MLREAGLDAVDEGVGLGAALRRGVELHDGRVGVERSQGVPGGRSPALQQKPVGLETDGMWHAGQPRVPP